MTEDDSTRDGPGAAPTSLGNGRLHIRSTSGGPDIEVLGVDHTTFSIESDQ